jgi:septal ring factor EnvC (AmiA/AmiB activator)
MKLFVQTIAGRFGYFIIKKATLDKLTKELAETQARISSLQQQNSSLRQQNGALISSLEKQNRAVEAAGASNVSSRRGAPTVAR